MTPPSRDGHRHRITLDRWLARRLKKGETVGAKSSSMFDHIHYFNLEPKMDKYGNMVAVLVFNFREEQPDLDEDDHEHVGELQPDSYDAESYLSSY